MEYIKYTRAGAYETLTPGDAPTTTGKITAVIREPTSGEFNKRNAIAALITVESNTINFTIDGTAPTATSGTNAGHKVTSGQSYVIEGAGNVTAFMCIDAVSGSASSVKVTTFF